MGTNSSLVPHKKDIYATPHYHPVKYFFKKIMKISANKSVCKTHVKPYKLPKIVFNTCFSVHRRLCIMEAFVFEQYTTIFD